MCILLYLKQNKKAKKGCIHKLVDSAVCFKLHFTTFSVHTPMLLGTPESKTLNTHTGLVSMSSFV